MKFRQRLLGRSSLKSLFAQGQHDLATAEGRASERHRRVALTAAASALAKSISILTAFISVPLTLHYLGPERYGMWMAISSLVAILTFADLGIGNGMLNAIANAHGRDDTPAIKGFVSSGFFVLSALAVALLAIFALAYPFIPWPRLFNVDTPLARAEAGPALAVFFVCFTLAVPIGIVQRVQLALQRGFLASLWQCVASSMGLLGVIVAIRAEAGLPILVLGFIGAPLVASLLNNLIFFGWMQTDIAPRWSHLSRRVATQLLRIGGLFLVLQVVAALAYASDNFIIAHLLGPAAVAEFSVPERLFSLITMLLAMVLAPLWPAYGEAIAKRDVPWVRRTLRRSMMIAVATAALFSFSLVLIGPWVIRAWVGTVIAPSMTLLLGLAVWKTIEAGASALAVFLNGANVVAIQLVVASTTLVVALVLKFFLIPEIGVAGAVWATAIAYTLCALIPYSLLLSRLVNRATAQ